MATTTDFRSFGFLRTFMAWLFGMVFIYLAAVTVIDPNRHFEGHWFPNIRPASRSDKVRLFTQYQAKGTVTGLIFGSSRSMLLPPHQFDDALHKRFFNAAVFNAFPEDYLAIYRALVQRGARPEAVIVGFDDDRLDELESSDEETEANYMLESQLDDSIKGPIGFLRHRIYHYKLSLSSIMLSNMFSAVQVFYRGTQAKYAFGEDGRVLDGKTIGNVNDRAVTLLEEMDHLSTRRTGLLETLIREASSQGARVMFFMTPYRPAMLEQIRMDPRAWAHHTMAVNYILSLGLQFGITVKDYTDETTFGGTADEWYDGVHYGNGNAARLAGQLIHDGF